MKTRHIHILILLTMTLLTPLAGHAQDIVMHTFGHRDTTISGCTLYDDGGPNGNYSSRCEATYTFHTVGAGNYFRIRIDYSQMAHQPGLSLLEIYNGDSTAMSDATRIFTSADYYWYSWRRFYYSYDSVITIRFHADDDEPTPGWWVELCESGGMTVQNVDYEILDSTSVRISWSEPDTSIHWILQYRVASDEDPSVAMMDTDIDFTTLYVDTNYFIITGLPLGQQILYNIYTESAAPCNISGYGVVCPCITPREYEAHYDDDSLRIVWRQDPNVVFWHLWGHDPTGFDTILPGTDTCWTVAYQCSDAIYYYFELKGNCTWPARCAMDWMYPQPLKCSNIDAFRRQNVTDNSIAFSWNPLSDSVYAYVTGYRDVNWPQDSIILFDTIYNAPWADTIVGLEPNTLYEIWVYTACEPNSWSCGYHTALPTTLDNCIDYINVWDTSRAYLTWGTYDDPFYSQGRESLCVWDISYCYNMPGDDNSSFNYTERHMPFTDTNAYDWRTNYALRCVPHGAKASIRLGDDQVGAKAESITYSYNVDTLVNDMLVLRYALVMQNPGHTVLNQPHFTMEILDSAGVLIDSTCCYADFFAADNMEGWDAVTGTNIIFKDWTTVGIDLAPYHGQRIKVRLVNKDCAEGGHFSYAYFTIHCDNKRIVLVNRCEAIDSIHLVAPIGFDYSWWREGDTTVLGNTHDILVPVDSNVYHCRCSFVGKPQCNFTMSTVAVNVIPHAIMHYWVDTCRQLAFFVDSSYREAGEGFGVYTDQIIDTSYWVVDGVPTSYADTLVLELNENRIYEIEDVCKLSNSLCVNSVATQIYVDFAYRRTIDGDSLLCDGDSLKLRANITPHNSFVYLWSNGSTAESIAVMPGDADTVVWVAYYDGHCTDTLRRRVVVSPIYNDTVLAEGCAGYVYDSLGFHEDRTGDYSLFMYNRYGCDSSITLRLLVHPVYNDTIRVATCDTSFIGLGFHADTSGLYSRTLSTVAGGCDSVVNLLLVRKKAYIWGDTVACLGNPIVLHSTDFTDEGARYRWAAGPDTPVAYLLADTSDSPYRLDIVVNDTCSYHLSYDILIRHLTNDTAVVNICGGWCDTLGFHENQTGVYTMHYQDRYGCDSLSSLDLTVRPNYYDTIIAETCDEPYYDYGFLADSSGAYTQDLATKYGCDSIVRLFFTRHSLFRDTINAEIYTGDTYIGYGFSESSEGVYEKIFTDVYSCDSAYVLNLSVVGLWFPNAVTPNGDGVNDRFDIVDLLESEMFDWSCLWIYNRTGRLVYKGENISSTAECWDPNATNSPTGTYFYVFRARSLEKSFEHKGVIEVLRNDD